MSAERWHFPKQSPASLGIDSAGVERFLDALENEHIDIHSFLMIRHGKLAVEGYWTPYSPDKPYTLFSASKTFTAMGVGFAIQDGLLRIDDQVLLHFQEEVEAIGADNICENMKKVTIWNLLTMTVGFEEDPHDFPFEGRTDWIRNFLTARVPHEPGSKFVYSTHASYMLSALVQKVTGKTLWAYLQEKLFTSLGITGEWWEESPQHISVGGWGLMLVTEDYAKIGQFLLQNGKWNGQQLLDADWVREAVSCQVSNQENPTPNLMDAPDFQSGYGYQIWRLRKEDAYMASGGFGQYVMVFPKKDAVVAMTCGTHEDHLFENVWKELYPALKDDTADDMTSDQALQERMSRLTIPLPVGNPHHEAMEKTYHQVTYQFENSRYGFQKISFDFSEEEPRVTLTLPEGAFTVKAGFGRWNDGKTSILLEDTDTDFNAIYPDVSCAYAWEDGALILKMVYDHTPFYDTFRIGFYDAVLKIKAQRNVWHYGETIDPVLYGFCPEKAEEKTK